MLERDVTAPWAKDLKLKKSTTKEPAPLVNAPSQQQEPKAQIIAKGVASGGENPWGVQLKKNRRKFCFRSTAILSSV